MNDAVLSLYRSLNEALRQQLQTDQHDEEQGQSSDFNHIVSSCIDNAGYIAREQEDHDV